jgi:hypothetical protein
VRVDDRDVSLLVGVLAILQGELLSGEVSPQLVRKLHDRFAQYQLARQQPGSSRDVEALLDGLNQRLRVARGEGDGIP